MRRFWDRNDVKGAIAAMEKMADHSVGLLFLELLSVLFLPLFFSQDLSLPFREDTAYLFYIHTLMQVIADVVSILTEKTDIVTLEICACLLPLLASLLESDMDR